MIQETLRLHAAWLQGDPAGIMADLRGSYLSEADLAGVDLSRANLSGANLIGADLYEANLSRVTLSRAALSRATLSRADLRGADLSWSDSHDANMAGANLAGANLSWTGLKRANLRGANLRGASLHKAVLAGVSLSGANLTGADLSMAYLLGAKHDARTVWPDPEKMLLANWETVSGDLCRDLMRYDAAHHPDGDAPFTNWSLGGTCPYLGYTVAVRAANFYQQRSLWSPGPAPSAEELVERLLAEKTLRS
jgi:uncharacterized protein YjbI with pentapeptide repeats